MKAGLTLRRLTCRLWHGICSVICESCFTTVNQDVRCESRFSSENDSFCENDGFSVVNPVLGLKPALSDKIGFFL